MVPMLDMSEAIAAKFDGNFTVQGNDVLYKGQPVQGYLIDRILFFMRELPNQAKRLIKFAENLYANPCPLSLNSFTSSLSIITCPLRTMAVSWLTRVWVQITTQFLVVVFQDSQG